MHIQRDRRWQPCRRAAKGSHGHNPARRDPRAEGSSSLTPPHAQLIQRFSDNSLLLQVESKVY